MPYSAAIHKAFILAAVLMAGFAFSMSAYAGAWPDNRIGAGFGIQVKPERTDDEDMSRIHDMGFHYLRYDIRWIEVEYQRGRYDWSRFDDFIGRMRAHHLKAVVILNGGNPIYSGNVDVPPDKAFGNKTAPRAPTSDEDVHAFADFAVAAVRRYGTDDIIWEIWNEPDMLAFWPPQPDAHAFAKLASVTCSAMRYAAPNAIIVAPGMAHLPSASDGDADFLSELLKTSAADCLTALSLHPYRLKQPPESVKASYEEKVRPFIASLTAPGRKPLSFISSEWGYPSNRISEQDQADYLLRTYLSNLVNGVPLSIWYEWKDSRPGPAPDDIEAHFGIINYDGSDKAAATAALALLPKIKDAVIEETVATANINCYILRLRQPDGTHPLLAWIGNDQMSGDKNLVTGRGASRQRYKLTSRPQLFNAAVANPVFCE